MKFFHAQSKEEREHAEKLMSLQNKRGGRIFLQDVKVCADTFSSHLTVLQTCCLCRFTKQVFYKGLVVIPLSVRLQVPNYDAIINSTVSYFCDIGTSVLNCSELFMSVSET